MKVLAELADPQTLDGSRYDTLLITERHDSLLAIQWENTVGYLRHYHDRVIAANPAARTFFYHSWLDLNKADPGPWIAHEKNARVAWECAVAKVNLTLDDAGRQDRIQMLPAGTALVELVERILAGEIPSISGTSTQRMNVLFSDNVHLTSLGMYYMALVAYSVVFNRSPEGSAVPAALSGQLEAAAAFQRIAWDYVQSYRAANSLASRTMASCRSFVSSDTCISYHTLVGTPGNITGCQNHFSSSTHSTFRWPDASFSPLPAP
jgi:hypothetical protein